MQAGVLLCDSFLFKCIQFHLSCLRIFLSYPFVSALPEHNFVLALRKQEQVRLGMVLFAHCLV